jgi:hypothetical protein
MIRLSLNYAGVCTAGVEVWRWHRIQTDELFAVLHERGTVNAGMRTEYTLADPLTAPGDAYQPASFLDAVRGRADQLIKYHHPWLDNDQYLISSGYFYAPNCIQNWKPPE